MRRDLVALIHGAYWVLYAALLAFMFMVMRVPHGGGAPSDSVAAILPIFALAVLPNVLAFYTAYGAVSAWFLERRRIGATLAGCAVACVVASAAGLLAAIILFGIHQPALSNPRETVALVLLFATLAAVHAAIALVLRGFIRWYGDLAVKEDLTRRTHAMELALVRARLDPHFLFNTLNNIDVLIARDPRRASDYLNKLCEILRFVLYDARGDHIALADELSYIDKYITLEGIRKRSARHAAHEVVGDPSGLSIAPMTFIPFIENAFKHADGWKADDAVVSRVEIDGTRVVFECTNRVAPPSHQRASARGLGDELIRRRLQLLYPDRHVLEAGTRGDRYRVCLTIQA